MLKYITVDLFPLLVIGGAILALSPLIIIAKIWLYFKRKQEKGKC